MRISKKEAKLQVKIKELLIAEVPLTFLLTTGRCGGVTGGRPGGIPPERPGVPVPEVKKIKPDLQPPQW